MKSYICKNVQLKQGKNGAYYTVETESGERFNLFNKLGGNLKPGIEFYADLRDVEKNGKTYTNVAKQDDGSLAFSVNMSTPQFAGEYEETLSDHVTDRERQKSIEAQNAFANLAKMACEFPLWDDAERMRLANDLEKYGRAKLGLSKE